MVRDVLRMERKGTKENDNLWRTNDVLKIAVRGIAWLLGLAGDLFLRVRICTTKKDLATLTMLSDLESITFTWVNIQL